MYKRNLKGYVARILRKLGACALRLAEELGCRRSKLIEHGEPRSLYRLPAGYDLWLNSTGYIDKQIVSRGEFEPASTRAIEHFVKRGDVVIDVGANIGYYTVLISKLVGSSGKVIAFEPTRHFADVLRRNIQANRLSNVEVVNFGLSNKTQDLLIDIGPSSATLHSPEGFDAIISHENISLTTLNEFLKQRPPGKIDFIKMDIDGHEPLFFEGAWETLEKYSPIVIFEVSHLHYLEAGFSAWEFYDLVRSKGYKFFYEEDFTEIVSREDFLRRCANFAYSSNVLIAKQDLLESPSRMSEFRQASDRIKDAGENHEVQLLLVE